RLEKGNIFSSCGSPGLPSPGAPNTVPMPVSLTSLLASLPSSLTRPQFIFRMQVLSVIVFEEFGKKGDIYNILWALVFGFATLNILGLVARRFEPNRNRLNFGESI